MQLLDKHKQQQDTGTPLQETSTQIEDIDPKIIDIVLTHAMIRATQQPGFAGLDPQVTQNFQGLFTTVVQEANQVWEHAQQNSADSGHQPPQAPQDSNVMGLDVAPGREDLCAILRAADDHLDEFPQDWGPQKRMRTRRPWESDNCMANTAQEACWGGLFGNFGDFGPRGLEWC